MSKNKNKDKNKSKDQPEQSTNDNNSAEQQASANGKGNSKNTGGGTEQSFRNTPQAKDDLFGTGSGRIDYLDSVYFLDVMDNDLAGNAKWLWSVDDGVNDSGAMDGYEAGDLLTQDEAGVSGLAGNTSQFGAAIWITTDGKIAYDAGSISGQPSADLTELALGDTLTDSFIYAIRMANGTLSWAQASVTVTGVNDTPTVESVSISAVEDGSAVSGTFLGDDVDSDNDINDLTYTIVGGPSAGSLTNNGDGTFTFNPGSDFQSLAQGEPTTITLSYTATDRHGAVSDPASLSITVTGVNDAPTLAAGSGAADEDGNTVSIDLAPLGDDVDSDDSGSSLTYSVTGQPAEGSASISGTSLTFSPDDDFQNLAEGETRDVIVKVTATDTHGASAVNNVTITVTGKNDVPTVEAVSVAAVEDGNAVTGAFVGDDVDSDDNVSTLQYNIIGGPSAGSLANNGDGTFTFNPGGDFQGLAKNQLTTITLTYTATDNKGAVSAPATLTIDVTGINDDPTLAAGTGAATEDGNAIAVDLSALGADVDSDNDGSNLSYSISGAPSEGSANITGTSLSFAPGNDFQDLSEGETRQVVIGVTATDAHGASASNDITITVTGTNDAPTLAAGTLAAQEDGNTVSLDLTTLGDDVDSEDTGSSLSYSLLNAAPGGSASIDANGVLSFDPGTDFQNLAKDQAASFDLQVQATDSRGASTNNTVTVTVTGVNDSPTLTASGIAAIEDGSAVTLDLAALGNDVDGDDDGSTLNYAILNTPAGGSADVNGTVLSFNPEGDFQSLAQGETTTVDLQIQATDTHGASATNTVTVTVTGVNDAPEITGGDSSATVTMNPIQAPFKVEQWLGYDSDKLSNLQNHAANNAPDYTVYTSVVDYTDDPAGFAGEIPGSTPWPAAQATGETTTGGVNNNFFARLTTQILITEADTYTFRTFNDDGVFLSVNNDYIISNSGYFAETAFEGTKYLEPGIYPLELYFYEGGGEASLELSYKNSTGIYQHVGNSTLTAAGTLNFEDVDLTDVHSVSTTAAGSGTVGTLTATVASDTTGSGTGGSIAWTYELSGDDQESLKSLAAGETAEQEFVVTVSDGKGGTDTQTVSITIEGANDVAVLGNAVVDLTETDVQLTASGTLSITDVDNGEAFFNTQSNTAGAYGSFSIDANGNWSFASNGALDDLEEGELVTDIFNVTSIDGTSTTVTVNITGTADGPTAENDSGSLTASAVTARADNTVYWVDWQSITPIAGNAYGEVNVSGTITLPDRTIGVTYTGQIYSQQTYISPTNTTNYWRSSTDNGATWLQGGDGVYTSAEVLNGPGDTNFDFIALAYADTPRTITFSEPVENLFFAVASMNNNGYLFDQPFTVVSSADSANDRGNWGHTDGITLTDNNGQYGISTAGFSPNEFHGVLAINNAVGSLTWVSQSEEFWQGFTVGTYGVAQSATVSGNVLDNDDFGNGPPVEVSDVDGSAMVGNSVTLNLASGAILTVDRDGDYFYDDQGQFEYLAQGETFTETVQYTITDDRGYSDTATLSIVVTGINDAPVAVADSVTVNEDSSVTINVLANDTDPDNGDTLSIASVSNAQNGTVEIQNNQLIYTPYANFHGTDSISYVVSDAAGATSTASVDITVAPVADTFVISNLIQNGSFENSLNSWSYDQINYIGDWQAADGIRTLDLNAESGGGYVEQTIQTVPNQSYTVGFALSKNPGSPSGSETLRVSAAGQSQDYVFNDSNTTTNMLWDKHTFSFTANSPSTTLRLASADPAGGTDAWGPALDEVVAFASQSITGFDKLLGDKIDLSGLLNSINAPNDNTAFTGGFLDFQASGSDTLVRIDADGGANDYITVVTLVGVSLSETDTGNFIL
mgnify:CR=1 FL=1|tara:strand:+ start:563507 stop:569071 length:5565 start_codon:yes stop_codon:yes gene_type:complete